MSSHPFLLAPLLPSAVQHYRNLHVFDAVLLQAVDVVERDLLWDGPPIRLSNKGHLRLAAYLFKVRHMVSSVCEV